MIARISGSDTHNFSYDAKNRMVSVSGVATASLTYDGDGNRVKSTIGSVITTFIGSHYEKTGSTVTKYYPSTSLRASFGLMC